MNEKQRWLVVVAFAAAMAWMESATVVYLRMLIGRLEPHQPDPLPMYGGLGPIELIRELATLAMLLTVGWLAGGNWRTRLSSSMIAFGVWDILYYLCLAVIGPWPRSIWDWDILFLIPLPWWGPVLAPVAIALLLIVFGTLVTQLGRPERPAWPRAWAWGVGFGGAALALYVFMADSIRAIGGGVEAIRAVLPVWFNWPLFGVALALMAAPIVDVGRQIGGRRFNRESREWTRGANSVGAEKHA